MRNEIKKIREFIKDRLEKGPKNMVLGLSGGLDSAVVLHLVTPLITKENQLFLYQLPTTVNDNREDYIKAETLYKDCNRIGMHFAIIPIQETLNTFNNISIRKEDTLRIGNAAARIRMMTLYDKAKENNAIVLGTENRTEMLLGYATIGGDAVSDIEPIKDFYKTEVREMARELGVRDQFIEQAPSAGLWEGQTDEEELGFTYADADKVFTHAFRGMVGYGAWDTITDPDFRERVSLSADISLEIVNAVLDRTLAASFKQQIPYTYRRNK